MLDFYEIALQSTLRLTESQRSLLKAIATRYCENGRCQELGQRYTCCDANFCSHWRKSGCIEKPDYCLFFFCDLVLRHLSPKVRKVLRLDKLLEFENQFEDTTDLIAYMKALRGSE